MSEAKPIIPKKTSAIITAFMLNVLARLSTTAKPPAIIIIRITARLKADDQNDNLLLSFDTAVFFCIPLRRKFLLVFQEGYLTTLTN